MTENECKLGFVIDGAKQPGIDEQRSVGQRSRVNRWVFDNEESEFQGARGAFRAGREQRVSQLGDVLLDAAHRQQLQPSLPPLPWAELDYADPRLRVFCAHAFQI